MKKARLGELVGEVEEEEPEGEMVAGPSGEATTHDSGIMSSLFIYFFCYSCSHTHLYMHLVYINMFSSSCIPLLSPFLPFPEQMTPLMRRSQ